MSKLSGTRVSAKTEAAATTYVAVIREAETVQVWYTDISTPVLHPRVHAYLAAKLLVHRAGVAGLGKFVCHGAAKDEPPAAARVSRLNLDKHADIKAAPNPPIPRLHMAAISITEPQVVPDKSRNRPSVVPELPRELLCGRKVRYLADDVRVFIKCRLECDRSPIAYMDKFGHGPGRQVMCSVLCGGCTCPGLGFSQDAARRKKTKIV